MHFFTTPVLHFFRPFYLNVAARVLKRAAQDEERKTNFAVLQRYGRFLGAEEFILQLPGAWQRNSDI